MSFQTSLSLLVALMLLLGCSGKRTLFESGGSYDYKPKEEAEVRDSEAMHRATMRPYKVLGKWYYPTIVQIGDRFEGTASWYGPGFHGKHTSNGELYSMHEKTAAHKTLPMNTMLKVTHQRSGKSTVVRINDRGPFVANRIIDLSKAAAQEIGMVGEGTAPVKIEVLGFRGMVATLADKQSENSRSEIGSFSVQMGAFRQRQGAEITQKRYANVEGGYHAVIREDTLEDAPIYRVWLQGFRSEEEARDYIGRAKIEGAFIVGE